MSMPIRRALLVVSRRSRHGEGDLSACLERLHSLGLAVTVHAADRPEEVPALIRGCRAGIDLAILGGGDGTANLAAEALVERRLTLALLPLGTANDLARTPGMPSDLGRACEIIAAGHARRIDLGQVNGEYFFNVASAGIGAQVPQRQAGARKRRWKVFGYLPSVVEAYRATRPFGAEIDCDGAHHRLRCLHLAVGNGRHYGGGMTIAAEAGIDDGVLALSALRPQGLASLALLAPALRWGLQHEGGRMLSLRGRRIDVRALPVQAINADGELIAETPAKFRVARRALRLIVPDTSAE